MVSIKSIIVHLVIIAWASPAWGQARTIDICTDQNFWFPFSYAEQNQARGIHIDIVTHALANLNYKTSFFPRPWKRCLEQAAQGRFDAVVSASYKADRARRLIYPSDAETSPASKWRIMQVEYVVVTNKGNRYKFQGDLQSLPSPVRSPLGYSIVNDLEQEGVKVITSPDIRDCMQQLILSGRGAVVTPPQNARRLNRDPQFMGKIAIHRHPVTSKSYFIVFSRKTRKLKMVQMESIWVEIARLRNDSEYIGQLFDAYASSETLP